MSLRMTHTGEKLAKAASYLVSGYESINERLLWAVKDSNLHAKLEDQFEEGCRPLFREFRARITNAGGIDAAIRSMTPRDASNVATIIYQMFLHYWDEPAEFTREEAESQVDSMEWDEVGR